MGWKRCGARDKLPYSAYKVYCLLVYSRDCGAKDGRSIKSPWLSVVMCVFQNSFVKLKWSCFMCVGFWLILSLFSIFSALKIITKQEQQKTTIQLLYQVPDIYSNLTRLITCLFFIITHAVLCEQLPLPLHTVLRAFYFGGLSPQWVLVLPSWLWAAQPQTQATTTGSQRTTPALSNLVFTAHCTKSSKVWKPTGQVLLLWAYHRAEVALSVCDLYWGGSTVLCSVMYSSM